MIDTDRQEASVLRSPRFLERRRAVHAQRRRARLRLVVASVVVLALAGGAFALSRSALFAIESVSVRGATGLRAADVRRAAGLERGMPGLRVDLAAAAAGVERMPGVERATVRRQGSLRFSIEVVMRKPAVALASSSGLQLFDRTGVAVEGKGRGLPTLRSDDPDASARLAEVLAIWKASPRSLRRTVDHFEIQARGLVAVLSQGQVIFGDGSRAADKVEAWRLVAARVRSDDRRLLSLDLRAPDRPAVRVA